ncbi:uncharacterized protein LOC131255720 isoform X1 [Magnolia sinica]|uniref:uncharacterized protein LOC131255720 isoform X1 n=1 Tax=Magnolia sinica TaxID=86752 RepID=UPI002658FA2E|nr:uncharacterized protein LOC131255720 isoform X1 [Magnolia sinica]XP_058112501.1 uncharacterized protein LOC131255720 isoform X1 [Magnolia sinica]XP_058112502.1 uncharacterized protein LOC131255720 isoform X1 [Magnolia sinica]
MTLDLKIRLNQSILTSPSTGEQHVCLQQPLLTNSFDSVHSSLPPSFAPLLTSCSTENLKEAPEPMEIEFMYQIIRYLLDSFDYTTSSKYLLQSEPTSSNLVTHWIAGLWTAKTISPTVPSMFNKLMYEVA